MSELCSNFDSIIFSYCVVAIILDIKKMDIVGQILEETGGVGVDFILEDEMMEHMITTNNLVALLAPHGVWASSRDVQLDPPVSKVLKLKGASVAFLFRHSWSLFSTQQGLLLHILTDLMDKVKLIELKSHSLNFYPLPQILTAYMACTQPNTIGSTGVFMHVGH